MEDEAGVSYLYALQTNMFKFYSIRRLLCSYLWDRQGGAGGIKMEKPSGRRRQMPILRMQ